MYKAQSNVTAYEHWNYYEEYNDVYNRQKDFTNWSQQMEIIQQKLP